MLQAICLSYRKSPISSDIMSSAPPTYHDRSSSYLNNVASAAENRMLSSSTLAKDTTNGITKSKISTVLVSGSLPSLSEPTVTMVDTSAAAPRVAGKPLKSVGNENKPSGGNVADSVKTNLKNQTPINKKILTSTASTTPIVPATKPLYTDTWKYPTTPTMSRSQTAYNNTSAKSTSSVKSSTLPAGTSRSSTNSSHCHRRSSSFHKSSYIDMLFSIIIAIASYVSSLYEHLTS